MISCKQMGSRQQPVTKAHQEHLSWQQVHLKESRKTDRYLGFWSGCGFSRLLTLWQCAGHGIVIYWIMIISFLLHFTRDLVFTLEQSEGMIRSRGKLKIKDVKVIQYVILHDCKF